MSANFNIAMLRSIQQPLAESMEAIITQLTRLMAGQITGSELDQGQHAKLVRGSLEMIGCQAISRLAATLERGCEALVLPDRRGWDTARVEQVAKSLLLLAEGLDDQIKHMLVDNEDLPVRLWPVWAHVYESMGEPAPAPEDLFEPDPNFEDEKFQPLAVDYLAQVCDGMSERLSHAIAQLDSAHDGAGVAKALREAERVFNWAYGLRHRRGYQAYWLVMRARMAIGLIQDPALLEDKASWTVLLNESSIELQKFAKDALRVRPDLLLKVIRPLLTPWPQSWTNAHPALEEMDSRMGLSVFWKTVDEVQDQKLQLAVSQFVAHQDELLSLLASLRSEWTRYVSGEGRSSDPEVARSTVVDAIKALSSQKMLFSDPSAIIMLEAISRIGEKMPRFDAISEDMALEFASSVLVVEDSVERRGRVSPEFHEQSRTQQKRLSAAWEGNAEELASIPLVRWDAKKQERQTRQALSIVFQEVRKDLGGVEEMLVENFRGAAARPLERDAMVDTLSLADAVLRMLMCGPASRIVRAITLRLGEMPSSGVFPQQVQDEITLGITGLTSFLAARESGDEDAENLLRSAVSALLGEPLHKDADPSLLVPPPEQDVRPIPQEPQFQQEQAGQADISTEDEVEQEQDVRHELPVEEEISVASDEPSFDESNVVSEDAPLPAVEPEETADAPAEESVVSMEPVDTEELSEDQINEMLLNGMWDVPSRKEPDLVEFLLDESDSVLMEIVLQSGILEHDPTNEEARQSLRRQFHTIKGSGRIAGVVGLAQAAWWVENMLSEDEATYPAYRPRVDAVVKAAHTQFSDWFAELRQQGKVWIVASDLRADIDAMSLLSGSHTDDPPQEIDAEGADVLELVPTVEIEGFSMDEGSVDATVIDEDNVAPLDQAVEVPVGDADQDGFNTGEEIGRAVAPDDEEIAADSQAIADRSQEDENQIKTSQEDIEQIDAAQEVVVVTGLGEFDEEIFGLFEEDAKSQVSAINACLVRHDAGDEVDVVTLSRAAHTVASLAGGMGMVDLRRLARAVENALAVHPEDPLPEDMAIPSTLAEAAREISASIKQVYEDRTYAGVRANLADEVDALARPVILTEDDPSAHVVDLSESPKDETDHNTPDIVDLGVDDPGDEDELIDEIIDKMTEITDKLQEATMLLVKLSERRR